jgi:conjugative relaxase-like TrwC/TraI family protein
VFFRHTGRPPHRQNFLRDKRRVNAFYTIGVIGSWMLRIIQNNSGAGAKSYYSTADYYTEGQELTGVWRGQGAARLGLTGRVEQAAWDALCDNRDPNTGLPLTVRRKQNRTCGYDFNFHVPKSISLLYGLTRDQRILDAFRASVDDTMHLMEAEMKTRVRKNGKNEDRISGNFVYGEFIHFTSRPVDGVPDPHLHAHCFVFNSTFDQEENRWKAGQFKGQKQDAPYFEALFHSTMARRIAELNLPVMRTKKGWEIASLSKATLDKFSRRTALIEKEAKAKGITDAEQKSELGAKTRARKDKQLSMDDLRKEWMARLASDEQSGISELEQRIGDTPFLENLDRAQEAALLAIDHCLERKSVVPERTLLAEAIRRSIGDAKAETTERIVKQQPLILAEREGRRFVTTIEVLAQETQMIAFARNGRGSCPRLGSGHHVFKRNWLNEGQKRAVEHILNSTDRVMLLRGAAGTGKTSLMLEAVEGIEAHHHKVFTFAPSAEASRGVLASEGFKDAQTVARLLQDQSIQESVRNQVIWIDEAGLLGAKATAEVFDLADKFDARVILSGDRRQHSSVERGAALRLLENEAGLVPAEIKEIQRQKGEYRKCVQALSEGHTAEGFAKLEQLGWIREVPELERYELLARDYIAAIEAKKSALVISPTKLEGEWVTAEIRSELKRLGKIGSDERSFSVLTNANLTQAERADGVNYAPSDVLLFHQNAKGYRKGDRVVVGQDALPLDQAARFQAYHASTLSIAPGDIVRITRNGKTADERHALNNGSRYTVKGFTREGDIRFTNGWTVAKDFGNLASGYVVTSHASQGKTVDRVFVAQSSQSYPASSREQLYVSVSRAREQAVIFTDDKASLLEAVCHSDDRLTATEFVGERERGTTIQRMAGMASVKLDPTRTDRIREVTYER